MIHTLHLATNFSHGMSNRYSENISVGVEMEYIYIIILARETCKRPSSTIFVAGENVKTWLNPSSSLEIGSLAFLQKR